MADFPDAPTGAPATANGSSSLQPTKDNTASTCDQLATGPMAQNVREQSAKASTEFDNLAASRKTPANPAATGQPLTHYHSFFAELLSWKNPRVSAIAYASFVTLIFATRYLDILGWTLRLTYMALGISVLAEVTGKLVLNHGLATQFRPRSYHVLSKETLDAVIGDVHELINFFVIEAQRILFVENIGASVAAFLGAFLAYHLVKVMPLWGLALTATTTLFLVPLVYTSNKEIIDHYLEQASELANEQTSQLRSVASKHTAQATEVTKQYMGDYTTKAQQLLGRSSPELSSKSAPAPAVAPFPDPAAAAAEPLSSVKEDDFPAAPSSDLKTDEAAAPAATAPEAAVPEFQSEEPVVPEHEPMLVS